MWGGVILPDTYHPTSCRSLGCSLHQMQTLHDAPAAADCRRQSRFVERTEELHADLCRQGATQQPKERSLSKSFNGPANADSSAPASTMPRILRGRTIRGAEREQEL